MFTTVDQSMQKKRHWHAFGIAFIVSFLMFLIPVIIDKGIFTFYGDYNVQQIPFYQLAHRAVRSGDIFWNWYTDLGANFIGSYSFYLLFSPFFWLTLPFPNAWLPYLMAPLFVLKFSFAAFFSYFYFKRFVKNTTFAVAGSLLYAFSGFMIYNIFFNHFHDVVVFFPLLLIGVEKLIEGKGRGFFAFAVFVNAMINYWFFIGEVVFVILYFCIRITDEKVQHKFKLFLSVAVESVMGALMAMFVLLPSALTVMGNPRVDSSNMLSGWDMIYHYSPQRYLNIISVFFFPPDLPSRPNFFPDHGAKWASLAAWLPLVGMTGVISFLQSTKNHWLRKMIAVCALFALIRGLNSAFIFFNGSYYARWFYMFVMMNCLASVIALERCAEDIDYERGVKWSFVITSAIALAVGLLPKKSDGKTVIGLAKYKPEFWGWTLIALVALFAVYRIYQFYKGSAKLPKAIIVGTCCVSLLYGSVYLLVARGYSSTSDYVVNNAIANHGKFELPEEEGEFVRSDFYNCIENLGMFWELPNIQAFHSVVPTSIMEFYPTVGVTRDVSSKPQVSFYELRAFLSVKWLFINESTSNQKPITGFSFYDNQNGMNIYENDNYIPMGFTYDNYISYDTFMSVSENYRARTLLRAIVLTDEQIERHADILSPLEATSYSISYSDYENCVWERKLGSGYSFEIDNRGFTSKIELASEDLVFFSVPYEEGWSAYVNGQPAEIEKVNIGFMAVRVPAGDNTIRFEFMTPGLNIGLICFAGGTLALAVYCFIFWYIKRRKLAAQQALMQKLPEAEIDENPLFNEADPSFLDSKFLPDEADPANVDSFKINDDSDDLPSVFFSDDLPDIQSISDEKGSNRPTNEVGLTEEYIRKWLSERIIDDNDDGADDNN